MKVVTEMPESGQFVAVWVYEGVDSLAIRVNTLQSDLNNKQETAKL